MEPLLKGLLRGWGGSKANFLAEGFRMEISTPRQLLRSLGPLPETSARPTLHISADRKRGQRKGATSKNVKNRQKVSKRFLTLFDIFRAGQKNVKNRQKASNIFSTLFDNFRTAPIFRPLLGASEHTPPPRTSERLQWLCCAVAWLFSHHFPCSMLDQKP